MVDVEPYYYINYATIFLLKEHYRSNFLFYRSDITLFYR